jgi:hypothetical protein
MAKRAYDIVVKIGEKSDGKAIWQTVGVMMEGDRGPFILLNRTFNPAGVPVKNPGDSSILCSLFEPKDFAPQARPASRKQDDDNFSEDIPF